MSGQETGRRTRGFSLLELLVVAAVAVVITAVATPNIITAVSNSRLKSAINSFGSVAQNARIRAVRGNQFQQIRSVTDAGGAYAYVDMDGNGTMNGNESATRAQLPRGITIQSAGAPALDTTEVGFQDWDLALPAFNPRGVPCQVAGNTCTPTAGRGYVLFLRQERMFGQVGWAAVTVNPNGRVRTWVWSGTRWN